jgi:hypothetical protein
MAPCCGTAKCGHNASIKDSDSFQKRTKQHREPHLWTISPPSTQPGRPRLIEPLIRSPSKYVDLYRECAGHLRRFPQRPWQSKHLRSRRPASLAALTRVQSLVSTLRAANHLTNHPLSHRQRPQCLSRKYLHQREQDQDDGSQWLHAWYQRRRSVRSSKCTPKVENIKFAAIAFLGQQAEKAEDAMRLRTQKSAPRVAPLRPVRHPCAQL